MNSRPFKLLSHEELVPPLVIFNELAVPRWGQVITDNGNSSRQYPVVVALNLGSELIFH
jgi:hypothetical protein